jgi:hypothetical protein
MVLQKALAFVASSKREMMISAVGERRRRFLGVLDAKLLVIVVKSVR